MFKMNNNVLIRTFKGENGHSDADLRQSAEEMDEMRKKNIAYQYLCHLEEAKKWLEMCLKESLPPTTELEEHLRNGVYLAKLGHFISPETVCLSKIYDLEQKRYRIFGLQFRHTDNISYWLKSLSAVGLPLTFHPETTDVYDKKNMPRAIYCLHALSTHLFKLGKAPLMQDLYGQVDFTDDEINAVCKELEKYGIQMPPFQKIGGILTNDLNGDKAQLHAAVIAVNEAIDKQDCNETMVTLLNPIVDFKHLNKNLSAEYQDVLYEAKRNKTISAHNKSLSESYIGDAYDELLTHGEIQGHISSVNFASNWSKIIESAEKRQYQLFKILLRSPFLQIEEIKDGLIPQYCEYLCKTLSTTNLNNNVFMSEGQSFLQNVVNNCNNVNDLKETKEHAVIIVNKSLDGNDCWDTLQALKNSVLELEGVDDFAAPLYYEEMKNDRIDSGADIGLMEIQACVRVLSLVANITKMVNTKSVADTWMALSHPDLHIKDLDPSMKNQYWKALHECCQVKMSSNASCPLLTYMDVQDCVDMVNLPYEENRLKIEILNKMNAAIASNDHAGLLIALRHPSIEAKGIEDALGPLYMKLLKERVTKKDLDEGTELWIDDVFEVINKAHLESNEVQKVRDSLRIINFDLMHNKGDQCFSKLTTFLFKEKFYDNLKPIYFRRLQEYKCKRENQYKNPWVIHCTNEGNVAFINLEGGDLVWEPPENFKYGSSFLNVKEIEHVIAYVNKKYTSSDEDERQITSFIRFQAYVRGFLVRQKQKMVLLEQKKQNEAAKKIQVCWRNAHQRKLLGSKLQLKKDPYKCYQKEKEEKVVKIQALWRGHQARQAFLSLVHQPNPSLKVVRYFAPLLGWNREDYRKEIELQTLKGQVVQNIRHSQLLSQQLDSMDIKIGLLVQNRITLQDVVAHGTTLNDLAKGSKKRDGNCKNISEAVCGGSAAVKGLKSLTKESRRLLEGYQNLFYLLQTRPSYLSKLIFCLPQSKTTRFLQTVILTLYNFGSNAREEYLLLRLFQSALEEEVKWKILKISDTVTGNPLVLKLVIRYARQHSGQNCLHTIVGPLIEKILNNKSLVMDTNPVEIYKSWINQIETETGKPSGLPYTVTQEKALSFEEVQIRLNEGIKNLKESTLMFLNHILESKNQLPYGLLFIAKVLKNSLAAKFPNAPEKDLLKVIGNFIYYQFINSAIVAPDAFDIITLPADKSLSNDRRRNLASIAKILQFAASKKGFGEESKHLTCLNPFIIECHEKFKKFFRQCCEVEEPEDHFSIHEFSEATLISRPVIYITFQEICDTHSLLIDYQEQIAPDPMDPIHEILEDLGSKPCVGELVGAAYPEGPTGKAANTTFYLTLTNKFEVPEDDVTDANKIFIQVKQLLVAALPYLYGSNLSEALKTPSTSLQVKRFEEFQRCRWMQQQADQSSCMASSFCNDKIGSSLEECKLQIRIYLTRLELEGFISQDDHYQTILTAIARDICNRRKYRQIRLKELQTLRATKNSLDMKIQFCEEQVDYYNQYIKKCLENLNAGKGSVHSLKSLNKHPGKIKSNMGIKYTADKLSAKGIILEIEGLPKSQFKNVLFEILPTEENGIFEVKGKFMGVEMEKIEIDIQNLLQLQFEGVSIMDIFGKAKLNINLLLFLLNKKFYGKT